MVRAVSSLHPTIRRLFHGRKAVVCTMHGKELIMRPLLKQYLSLNAESISGLDTDEFGTFSGEISRPSDPVTTLRRKILKGLALSGQTLGVGNEGSFGPHPKMPLIQANQEIVMLVDLENDIEIYESHTSSETNHAQRLIRNMADLLEFAERINFPSHGMVLKQVRDGKMLEMRKGIITWDCLYAELLRLTADGITLLAESDMRAYLNPTRMKTIEKATELLMKKIINTCPNCQWPGFQPVEVKTGLPCRCCGNPTELTLSKVYHCNNCSYSDERFYTMGEAADPQYCDRCNP